MSEAHVGRRTPYEVVCGDEWFAGEGFPALEAEAAERDIALTEREQFALLARVGAVLQRVVPEEIEPAALANYLDIIFHSYQFWKAGCQVYAFEEGVARSLVETAPALSDWMPRSPARSVYLELPRNLFWAAVTEAGPPEPVEGIFLALGDDATARISALAVLGMRPDRGGFSVVEVSADLVEAAAQSDPGAFVPDIPGADLAGLFALHNPAELLMLVARLLWYVDVYPQAVELTRAQPAASDGGEATALDHRRVRPLDRSRG